MRIVLLLSVLLSVLPLSAAEASTYCVKWRATSNCDPHGQREPHNDGACSKRIASGLSGYCECENRRRVREVECEHHKFSCEEACAEDSSADLSYPQGFEHVTCGSSIKLVHEASRYRLHSHEIQYGGGSGQQSVTTHMARNDVNSYWLVKEGDGETACQMGKPIECGATIRLEHMQTRRNLHSHMFKAPLSSQHLEVSAFGVAGEGDRLDSWILECQENQQCSAEGQCEDDGLWKRGELVRFRHRSTSQVLYTSSKSRFDDSNCPNCPINGQQEVSATSHRDADTLWFAGEGIYVTE
ncbi:Stromal cell-derived factor 2 precursor [Phytophthora megakarya]|uniref:Stromal cell-derived factor 2 n=1 Tax=Phytophthora megakarya TaxID=4795 RepID=A0A225WKC8_9STRA|nr:Stromal cell-derived factor 2 precursor [Phytophthora megakarya]